MKEMTLKHPRKAMWAMRDFMNEASTMTYHIGYWDDEKGGIIHEKGKRMCEMVKSSSGGFGACVDYWDPKTFNIFYNFDELMYHFGTRQFREDFISRCPMGRGFADITLVLLHELGHFMTNDNDFGDFDRDAEMEFLQTIPVEFRNLLYFCFPDETAATDWAIEWLQDAEHRRMAKAFEKKFFACFKK